MRYIAIYAFTFSTVPSKYHQQIMQIVVILIEVLFDHFWMVTPFLYPTISTIKPTRLCTQNIAIMLQGNCLDRFENINHKLYKLQQICIIYKYNASHPTKEYVYIDVYFSYIFVYFLRLSYYSSSNVLFSFSVRHHIFPNCKFRKLERDCLIEHTEIYPLGNGNVVFHFY